MRTLIIFLCGVILMMASHMWFKVGLVKEPLFTGIFYFILGCSIVTDDYN